MDKSKSSAEQAAEILQKELDKIFKQHIEDLKNMKVAEEK